MTDMIKRWQEEDLVFEVEEVKKNKLFHSGGKGSGDFGHSGRPGMVGGSDSSSYKSIDDIPDSIYNVVIDDISITAREYHNDASQSKLNDLLSAVSGNAGRIIALEDIRSRVQFDKDGNVTLYRGGDNTGLSWSTDRKWAERFATFEYGLKKKKTAKVFEKKFNIDEILYALPWEGEVIVR